MSKTVLKNEAVETLRKFKTQITTQAYWKYVTIINTSPSKAKLSKMIKELNQIPELKTDHNKKVKISELKIKRPDLQPKLNEYHMKANINYTRTYIQDRKSKKTTNDRTKGVIYQNRYTDEKQHSYNDYSKIIFASSPKQAQEKLTAMIQNEFNKGGMWHMDTSNSRYIN